MTAIFIIIGILAFIFLLLMIPLTVKFNYGEETALVVKYLFLKFKLFPAEEKAKKKEKETKAPEPHESKIKELISKIRELKNRRGLHGLLEIFKDIAKLAGSAAIKIIKRIKVKELDVYAVAGGENAAETAILYGEACAVIYPAVNMVRGQCRCKKTGVTVNADYGAPESSAICTAVISIRPIFLAGQGIKFVFKLIPLMLRLK